MYYIYALHLQGTYDFRYVGLTTKTPEERFRSHLKEAARKDNRAVLKWLRKHPLTAIPYVLEEVPEDFEYLCHRESFWIAALRERGYRLLNHTDGGEGRLGNTGPRVNRIGEKFGDLTVTDLASISPTRWVCLCKCGNTCTPVTGNLTSGNSTTCGKCTSGDACLAENCDKPRYGIGNGHSSTLCVTHHMRRFRYGSLEQPNTAALQKRNELLGKTFGTVTVTEWVSAGRYRWTCTCGVVGESRSNTLPVRKTCGIRKNHPK